MLKVRIESEVEAGQVRVTTTFRWKAADGQEATTAPATCLLPYPQWEAFLGAMFIAATYTGGEFSVEEVGGAAVEAAQPKEAAIPEVRTAEEAEAVVRHTVGRWPWRPGRELEADAH